MPITFERTSAPSAEPITTSEAKNHLRVDTSDDDTLIDSLVTAAREHVEMTIGRSLITQTLKFYLDAFPLSELIDHQWYAYLGIRANQIILPRPPVQSVDSIEYVDTDGSTQTLSSSKYRVDKVSEPPRITEADNETWPFTDNVTNSVIITYTAGYGGSGSDVPQAIRQAMLLLIGNWYENREQVLVGSSPSQLPMAAQALLSPYQVRF